MLFVLTGLLGDTVMCTPVLAEARRLFPDARLIGLANSLSRDLLEPAGWLDEFVVYDGSPFPWRPAKWRVLRECERQLQGAQIDVAVILLGDDVAPLLCRAGIPVRVGVEGTSCERLLTHRYSVEPVRTWGPDERLNALRCFGLNVCSMRPRLAVSAMARSTLAEKLSHRGVGDGVVAFHPFAASASRRLPVEKAAAIARAMRDETGADVALIGGPPFWNDAAAVISALANQEGIHNLAGELSIQETCALIEKARVTVTPDSGPMHIAGALERPAVGLFRAIRPEYASLYPSVEPVFWREGKQCLRGCGWESWHGCELTPCRQLAGIDDGEIVAAVSRQWEQTEVEVHA